MLNCSRDKNEGTYRGGDGGRMARYVTPDLSYYWEGATEQCKDNKWDGEKKNGMRESVS